MLIVRFAALCGLFAAFAPDTGQYQTQPAPEAFIAPIAVDNATTPPFAPESKSSPIATTAQSAAANTLGVGATLLIGFLCLLPVTGIAVGYNLTIATALDYLGVMKVTAMQEIAAVSAAGVLFPAAVVTAVGGTAALMGGISYSIHPANTESKGALSF